MGRVLRPVVGRRFSELGAVGALVVPIVRMLHDVVSRALVSIRFSSGEIISILRGGWLKVLPIIMVEIRHMIGCGRRRPSRRGGGLGGCVVGAESRSAGQRLGGVAVAGG